MYSYNNIFLIYNSIYTSCLIFEKKYYLKILLENVKNCTHLIRWEWGSKTFSVIQKKFSTGRTGYPTLRSYVCRITGTILYHYYYLILLYVFFSLSGSLIWLVCLYLSRLYKYIMNHYTEIKAKMDLSLLAASV